MKAKLFLTMMTLLLVAGVNAQKIDQRLTRLVERNDTRSAQNRITLNPQTVKQQIAVDFNADGTTRIKKVLDYSTGTKQVFDTDETIMMGQRVDKSQKGLVIYKGRKYVNK